ALRQPRLTLITLRHPPRPRDGLAAIKIPSDHPPSGDGGYSKIAGVCGSKAAKAYVDNSAASNAATRWIGCDQTPFRSSTIWRWWLR
ncbi:MAG: hypothetical protein ACK56Q_03905, partial [Pirellulaceae bacterium]